MKAKAGSITLAVAMCLVFLGCEKDAPPPAPAVSPNPVATQPGVVKAVSHDNSNYVGALLVSRDMAKRAVSQSNLVGLSQAITMYALQNGGKFPATLDDLVKSGAIASDALASPADKNIKYAYLPGQTQSSPADNILIYEPVSYNGKVVLLTVDGAVSMIDQAQLDERLAAQGKR